jgi:hypothetical protein
MRFIKLATICCCTLAAVLTLPQLAPAQAAPAADSAPKKLTSPPAKAEVSLSGAAISIDYNSPSMRGRVIFGGLVPYGQVWRTGANSATTLKTATDLTIGDLKVPAGTYTLYSLPTEAGWKLIVNKQTGQWGTVYDEKQDLGRVDMKVGKTPAPLESMVIDFENTMGDMGMTELHVKWAGVDASVAVTAAK